MTRAEMPRDRSAAAVERWFNTLLAAEGPSLMRLAASYARTAGDRDDLFQDIATAIWRALPGFRGECSDRTFVFRIAHNRGIAYIARRRKLTAEIDEAALRDPRPNPETALSRDEQNQRLLNAVRELPLGYRQVITLTLEDCTYAEIGEVLGITESNVGARLTRARQMLRRLLQERP